MPNIGEARGVMFRCYVKREKLNGIQQNDKEDFIKLMWDLFEEFNEKKVESYVILDPENDFTVENGKKGKMRIEADRERPMVDELLEINDDEVGLVTYNCNRESTFGVETECDFDIENDVMVAVTRGFCIMPTISDIYIDKRPDCKIKLSVISLGELQPQRFGVYFTGRNKERQLFAVDSGDVKLKTEKERFEKVFETIYECLIKGDGDSITSCFEKEKLFQNICKMPS